MLFLFAPAALAADPVVEAPKPDVNPTVQYLAEQLKVAMESGIPLASEGIQNILTQVHYLGIGLLIYDGFLVLLATLAMFIGYKIVSGLRERMEESEFMARMFGGIAVFAAGIFLLVCGLDEVQEHIKMTAAPVVWAMQEMM